MNYLYMGLGMFFSGLIIILAINFPVIIDKFNKISLKNNKTKIKFEK